MPTSTLDAVVIGGGVAGMSAAWLLRHRNIVLLEESDRLGGRIRSEPRGDYWLNLGAHLFPGPGSTVHRMVEDLGLETVEIPGSKTGMYFDGRVRVHDRIEAYPLLLPLSIRERFALATVGLRLLALVKKWQRVAIPRRGESEQARRLRLAQAESQRSFRDVLGRPCGRINELFETAARRSSCEIHEQSAAVGAMLFASHWSGKNDSTALNLLGGSGKLPEAVHAQLRDKVRLGTRVLEVRDVPDGVEVRYEDSSGEHRVPARHAVVAAPATAARQIIRGLPQDVDQALAAVRYGQFVVLGIITKEHDPMPWDDVYALTTPGLAFSMFFNHANPLRNGARRIHGGSLMCYAGGDTARAAMSWTDEQIENEFTRDLLRVYPQLEGLIEETVVQRWTTGSQYRPPGRESFSALDRYAEQPDTTIHLAGDYYTPLGQIETAARSGAAAGRRVLQALDTDGVDHPAASIPGIGGTGLLPQHTDD
ncbi:FAD-dependent oxidoreductase [Mycobacterium sp. 21AC1]|uniref:flavin monoamine oxidase family protein n=1 Tax=[Mycobacterium] appelbergii TaxID=2939269 RepID=UPI002938DA9F|nr:NAD(P)/FAD-dependent oxidoreductase [Mycobacterium sp. 21AC1]MDV3128944.1 FAD-dependent oxidoreductase [Mycobacterium sp. 21AC1]